MALTETITLGACTLETSGTASENSGGSVDNRAVSRFESQSIPNAPSYLGTSNDAQGCSVEYATAGFEPIDPANARHPLFLYFVGTKFVAGDPSAIYTSDAARAVTEAMARRGFVALSADYDNGAIAWISDHQNQLECLFAGSNPKSLLAVACALPNVDCQKGIALWGHSQGALVADLAANYDARVRAAWTTGYGGDSRAKLARNRVRVVNGEADASNADASVLNSVAGFTSAECPNDGRDQCLRKDGSGWIIVRQADCQLTSADHCWFDKVNCLASQITLEPNWIDRASTKPFALEANADWVALTVQRP